MRLSIEHFFSYKNAPFFQAGALFLVIALANILGRILVGTGLVEWSILFPWVISGSLLLGYAMLNTLIGLTSKQPINLYYSKSIMGFIVLAVAAALIAQLFSSVSIGEAGSMRWIYIVITIGYLIFMGIMVLMRTIVEFAQREDENLRHKK